MADARPIRVPCSIPRDREYFAQREVARVGTRRCNGMLNKTRVLALIGAAAVAVGAAYVLLRRPPHVTPTSACGTESGTGCAPADQRVDVILPPFSNPTSITNPLFPATVVTQTLLLGNVDGHPLRVEYTLLPGTKTIPWDDRQVETRIVQYVAYLDRRIAEVALDWYAQADDGSVWYFGEDVANYSDGVVDNTDGTWLAGRDGPPAMIMPAEPSVGAVYRVEDIPGVVFEEVTVKRVGVTVAGPVGPVAGGMIGDQLHVDGSHSDKTFAPGYGEFSTERGGDIEAVALAVPTDAVAGPVPAELDTLVAGAARIFDAAADHDWTTVAATMTALRAAWSAFRARGNVPRLLDVEMTRALAALAGDPLDPAVDDRNVAGTRDAAIDVAQAGFDLQLRHRQPVDIDLARLDLWARRLLVDAASEDPGATVIGDIASLEIIRDRVAHALPPSDAQQLDARLRELGAAAEAGDFRRAAAMADELRALAQRLHQ